MGAFNGWAQHNVMAFSARAKLLFREVLFSQANCIYYMWKLKYRRQTIQLFAIITHNKIIVFITTEKPIPTASKSFVFVKWNRLIPPTVACHPSRKSVLVCVCVLQLKLFVLNRACSAVLFWVHFGADCYSFQRKRFDHRTKNSAFHSIISQIISQ